MFRTLLGAIACIIAVQCPSQAQALEGLVKLDLDTSICLKITLPASHIEARGIGQAVYDIENTLRARDGGYAPGTYLETLGLHDRPELISVDLPEATLGQQLDIISSKTDFVWIVVQGYICLIPRETAGDAKAAMNQVIPGEVVLSRKVGMGTSVRGWFQEHNITSTTEVHELSIAGRPKRYGPDTIVLKSPTLREYWVAFERLYGHNRCHVSISDSQSGDGKPGRVTISTSSGCIPNITPAAR